jgi:hypothetical protein
MKVAQYEVLGSLFLSGARPGSGRDDRNTRLLVSHAAQRLPALVDRPVRNGYSLKTLTQSGRCRILGFYEPDVVKAPLRKNVLKFFGSF